MPKRIVVGLSMQPEDAQLLEKHAATMGLSKSDLVRRLLYKLDADDKMQKMIPTPKFATLYNAHSVKWTKNTDETEEKKDPGHDSREDSSSLDPTNKLLPQDQIEKRMREIQQKAYGNETITMAEQREYIQLRKQLDIYKTIEIAKYDWINRDK